MLGMVGPLPKAGGLEDQDVKWLSMARIARDELGKCQSIKRSMENSRLKAMR